MPVDVQQAVRPSDAAATGASLGRSQLTIIVAILIGYAALSFYSDSRPDAVGLATGLSLVPVVLIGLALAWRWTRRWIATLISVATAAALYRFWGFFENSYQWSNLLQQAGAYALVALGFVRSLSPGQTPLCTQLADKLHGPLPPDEIAYTRRATMAWSMFYVLLTVAIVVVFFVASQHLWSMFVNFATFGLIALMFAIEHTVRLRVLPNSRRGGLLTALRQFLLGV